MTLPISPDGLRGLAQRAQQVASGPSGAFGEVMNGSLANNVQGLVNDAFSVGQNAAPSIGPQRPVVGDVELGRGMPLRAPNQGESFSDLLANAIGDVSRMQEKSHNAINAFLRGDAVDLHDVMAATEEASISLELLVEIRNKLADSYRTIMNMQA